MTRELPKIDYSTHPAYGLTLEPDAVLAEEGLRQLAPVIDQMKALEEDRIKRFGYRYGAKCELSESLSANGVTRVQLDPPAIDRISRAARPAVDKLQARIRAAREQGQSIRFKTTVESVTEESDPELWQAVDDAMRAANVYSAAANLFQASSGKLLSVAVMVNHANQEWANNIFPDCDLSPPATRGFHIDSSGKCRVKAVLYLTDVGRQQGPFSAIRGSHRWAEGSLDRVYRRAYDKSGLVARSKRWRQLFISLPPEMQVKAEFGGDILAGSELEEQLLAMEDVSLGERGLLSLFDPEVVHRGGNVAVGERHVLLISSGPVW